MNRSEIHVYRDGRVRLSGSAYFRMKSTLASLAEHKCEVCGKWIGSNGDIDHIEVRGMGGARRDDRIMVDGQRNLRYVCRTCHNGRHVPDKVVPRKERVSDEELRRLIGL